MDEQVEELKPAKVIKAKEPSVDKEEVRTKAIESLLTRVLISNRRHQIEGATFKNQIRAYLFAMEAKELGLSAEDIK